MSDNPLFDVEQLPPFSKIQAGHVEPAIDRLLTDARTALSAQLAGLSEPSWKTLVEPIESRDDQLNKAWSPVSHLHAVCNNDDLRKAYSAGVAKLTEYGTELGQNKDLFNAYQALATAPEFGNLNCAQQRSVNDAIRNFKLAGVDLPEDKQEMYGEIKNRLSELSTAFSNNVMDATQGWYKHIAESTELAGLPQSQLDSAGQQAKGKSLEGYIVTLDIPSYFAVMQYADNRVLREEIYRAYVSRASASSFCLDDSKGPWDNGPLIEEILSLRHQLAQLLGFNNYAERSIATKMASATEEVVDFLTELANKTRPVAEQDLAELKAFASANGLQDELQAWDLAYYGEKLKQEQYSVSQEELRQYFPAAKVQQGLFTIVNKLYGIDVVAEEGFDTWHEDVELYRVEKDGDVIARFYFDIYARENKRGGAWMDECRVRRINNGKLQLPVAYLVCNFTPPIGDKPSLLTHDEVTTLFHEFGHGLHHMLTKVDVAAVSGINGVPWDAVELPSQFMENWCWQGEALAMISSHHETGEPLPGDLLRKLLAAKNFQAGMQMLRQIEFSLFDFLLHQNYNADHPEDPQKVLDRIRKNIAVVTPPVFNKFQNGFSHIFSGGYAAGYYSYKWAEVLSADAFSKFEEEGIFNQRTGRRFLENILEKGGSQDIAELYKKFRGRQSNIDALLRHNGITA